MTKCPDCLAHYTGKHECDGLMKMIVGEHERGHPMCALCGAKMSAIHELGALYYCASPECPNYSLAAVRLSEK